MVERGGRGVTASPAPDRTPTRGEGIVADADIEEVEDLMVWPGRVCRARATVLLRVDALSVGIVALEPRHRVVDEPADRLLRLSLE